MQLTERNQRTALSPVASVQAVPNSKPAHRPSARWVQKDGKLICRWL